MPSHGECAYIYIRDFTSFRLGSNTQQANSFHVCLVGFDRTMVDSFAMCRARIQCAGVAVSNLDRDSKQHELLSGVQMKALRHLMRQRTIQETLTIEEKAILSAQMSKVPWAKDHLEQLLAVVDDVRGLTNRRGMQNFESFPKYLSTFDWDIVFKNEKDSELVCDILINVLTSRFNCVNPSEGTKKLVASIALHLLSKFQGVKGFKAKLLNHVRKHYEVRKKKIQRQGFVVAPSDYLTELPLDPEQLLRGSFAHLYDQFKVDGCWNPCPLPLNEVQVLGDSYNCRGMAEQEQNALFNQMHKLLSIEARLFNQKHTLRDADHDNSGAEGECNITYYGPYGPLGDAGPHGTKRHDLSLSDLVSKRRATMPGLDFGDSQASSGSDNSQASSGMELRIRPSQSGSWPRPSMSFDSSIFEATESQMQVVELPTPDLRSVARPFGGGFRAPYLPSESDARSLGDEYLQSESDARSRGDELFDAMEAKQKEKAAEKAAEKAEKKGAFQRLQGPSAKKVPIGAQQDSQSEQLSRSEKAKLGVQRLIAESRSEKAKLAVQRLIAAESVLAESVPAESVPADSKKLTKKKIAEQSAESQSRTKKDKIAELPKKTIRPCVNHEKTRKQFLVRTGLKNVSFRYGGSDKNRWASEGEAKKAAHEFFEANKAAHE